MKRNDINSNLCIIKKINEILVAVHRIKETSTLNKPSYPGMSILDLSETLMYDFHHKLCVKKKYGDKAKLFSLILIV